MEHNMRDPDNSHGKRVSNLLSQGQSFTTPLQRLVRIPEQPQDVSQKGETDCTAIRSNESNCRAPLPRVVKGKGLLTVGACCDQLSQSVQDRPQPKVRFQEESGVLRLLGQGHESLSQFTRGLQLGSHQIKGPRGPERPEELRGLTDLPAQLERASVDCSHFWGGKAFSDHQWQSQGAL